MGKNVLERGGLNDIKNLHPLASPADDKLEVCKAWYKAFDDRDLDELMKIFSEDPTVTVGAGGSRCLVPYAGTYEGEENVRWYYRARFQQASQAGQSQQNSQAGQGNARITIRPFCGYVFKPAQFGPWVIFSGTCQGLFRLFESVRRKFSARFPFLA